MSLLKRLNHLVPCIIHYLNGATGLMYIFCLYFTFTHTHTHTHTHTQKHTLIYNLSHSLVLMTPHTYLCVTPHYLREISLSKHTTLGAHCSPLSPTETHTHTHTHTHTAITQGT